MRIGIISTRISGTDGVTLEIWKWSTIFRQLGHELYYCAGELDPELKGAIVPHMHFHNEEIASVQGDIFCESADEKKIHKAVVRLKDHLYNEIKAFLEKYYIEVLIVENALSLPMNVPLALALNDLIRDLRLPTIAHHHDFGWERERFAVSWMQAELEEVFPPNSEYIHHVVINSLAQAELLRRRDLKAEIIPNIFDFTNFHYGLDNHNTGFREALDLSVKDWLVLQPTRIVPRKGIEHAIDLLSQIRAPKNRKRLLDRDVKLVLSHPSGDEGDTYFKDLQKIASDCGVPLVYAAKNLVINGRGPKKRGRFQLWDAYLNADFVTYPSLIEGFGNAFLETIFFRLPLLIRRYDVFVSDIEPLGFDLIKFDDKINPETTEEVLNVMLNPTRRRRMVEWNFSLARAHFSYQAVTEKFTHTIETCRV